MIPTNTVSFKGTVGPNLFWPLGGPVYTVSNNVNVYSSDPYTASSSGPWRTHVTANTIANCLAIGDNHFRLQPCPAPHMQGISTSNTSMLSALDAAHMQVVDDCVANGMAIHYSPFLSQPNIDPYSPLQGLATSTYQNYKSYIVRIAGLLAQRDQSMVMLGLMNEPPYPSFAADWITQVQPDLYQAVRAVAPKLTIALTVANYSSLYYMSGTNQSNSTQTLSTSFDPSPYDNNTLFEAHPFIPSVFCLQGANYDGRYTYVDTLEWPPVASDQAGAQARMTALVQANTSLSNTQMSALISGNGSVGQEIGYFYSIPQNEAWLSAQFDYLENWRVYRNIPPHRVYISEYGAVRQNPQFGGRGASRPSRARYYGAVNRQITKRGYRSSYDHLDTVDYGVTFGSYATIGNYDYVMMNPINPRTSKMVFYG